MENVKDLIDLLTLRQVDELIFEGDSYLTGWGRVFGGQVLGQALHAAYRTVPEDRYAHSMHGYFILAGDPTKPIRYEVDIIRDGGSFTTRRVIAKQNNRAIFTMGASFQLEQEGLEHQISIPNVLPPDALLNDFDQVQHLKDTNPELYRRLTIIHPNAIEFRPVEDFYKGKQTNRRPFRHVWFKARDMVDLDLRRQHELLAYASDYNLLTTAAVPHLSKLHGKSVFFASLDHAIYFHRRFRMDDWLLYATDSPSAGNSRAFSRGSIFDQEGELVASVIQEGLIRVSERKKK